MYHVARGLKVNMRLTSFLLSYSSHRVFCLRRPRNTIQIAFDHSRKERVDYRRRPAAASSAINPAYVLIMIGHQSRWQLSASVMSMWLSCASARVCGEYEQPNPLGLKRDCRPNNNNNNNIIIIYKQRSLEYKKLSYRRETARRFVSLNILLSQSIKMTLLSRACVSRYLFIENVCISFMRYSASKNGVTLKLGLEVVQGH